MQVAHRKSWLLLPSTATDVACHELQLSLAFPHLRFREGPERASQHDVFFQSQAAGV